MSAPTTPGAMLALPIAIGEASRLLRGPEGEACLLIAGNDSAAGADLKLRNVEAKMGIRCKIEAPDGTTSEVIGTLITCTAADPQLRRLFLSLMDEAIDALGSAPTAIAIAAWLQRIATLFARLEQEGRKRLRGLWAELAVMIALDDPTLAARRWHADPNERFDFMAGSFGLEVKSCQDLDRVHHFSLGQLRPPEDLDVWIASVMVRADPHGQSVLDLMHELERVITHGAIRSTLRATVLACGGAALEDDDLHRFDRAAALSTLRLYNARDVPSVNGDLPPEVLSVGLEVRCRNLLPVGTEIDARARLATGND